MSALVITGHVQCKTGCPLYPKSEQGSDASGTWSTLTLDAFVRHVEAQRNLGTAGDYVAPQMETEQAF